MNASGGKSRALGLLLMGLSLAVSNGCGEKARLSVAPLSLHFNGDDRDGVTPRAQMLTGEVLNHEGDGFLGVLHSENGLDQVAFNLANPFKVEVKPKSPRELGGGTYEDAVVIAACADEACNEHFEGSPLTVPVTYTVTGHLVVTPMNDREPDISGVIGGTPLPTFPIELRGSRRSWTASADQGWIKLGTTSGGTPATTTVTLDSKGLAAGIHTGRITFTDTESQELHHVRVTFRLEAPRFFGTLEVSFGERVDGDYRPVEVQVFLNTGTAVYPWTASIDHGGGPAWLTLSTLSGTLSGGPTGAPLYARANALGLPSGLYAANITFTTTVEGQTLTRVVPFRLAHREHRLFAPDDGVALVSTPSVNRLTASVVIKDTDFKDTTPWTASTNQDWLSVTPSGKTGGTLTLTANPAGLAPDTLHLATVTLQSSAPLVMKPLSLQVGLWVGSSAPDNLITVPTAYRAVETDPIRPYAYVHDGSNLFVYNVYTGAQVTMREGLGSASGLGLGGMTVSSDGSTLWLVDRDTRQVVPINLNTLSTGTRWSLGGGTSQGLAYLQPHGIGLVVAGDGHLYTAATGARLPPTFVARDAVSASRNDLHFCSVGPCTVSSCAQSQCYAPGISFDESVSLYPRHPLSLVGTAVALNHDASRYYLAPGSPTAFQVLDSFMNPVQTLAAGATPNGLAVGPDNRLYGSAYTKTGSADVWVYDNDGTQQGSFRLGSSTAGILDRQLKVSGDGKRLVALTESSLKFVTTP
jgi:hypothetical protein